ncbi:MAG: radical SAM protein [Oscillospiraceae bacterium]|nr:radical SAM protein [Oscillospiraceae bacterium]
MYSKVYVEITNVCNKNCSFCPKTERPPNFLSLNEFELITDKLIGVTKFLYLHLMGEPLCHPDLFKFIKIARKKDFKVIITTNGTLLSKRGHELIESGVHKVNISLHSFEEGSREEYETYINSCIDFADMSSDNGIVTVFRFWNNGFDEDITKNSIERIKNAISGEWQEERRGIRIKNSLYLEHAERFSWPDISAENSASSVFCYGLKDHFGILSDGRVVPCCLDRNADICLGNIFKEDIYDILNSERAKNLRDGFKCRNAVEKLCQSCGYARRF